MAPHEPLPGGVRRRVVFERAGLEAAGAFGPPGDPLTSVRLPARHGIADREVALPPAAEDDADPVMPVVLPSLLLDTLTALFDAVWAGGVPLVRRQDGRQPRSALRSRVLAMPVSGSTDAAMACSLGVAVRTVQRHVAAMQREAGVDNRIRFVRHAAGHGRLDDFPGGLPGGHPGERPPTVRVTGTRFCPAGRGPPAASRWRVTSAHAERQCSGAASESDHRGLLKGEAQELVPGNLEVEPTLGELVLDPIGAGGVDAGTYNDTVCDQLVDLPIEGYGILPAYVFSPDGRFAYETNTDTNQVTVYKVGPNGSLTPEFEPVDTGGAKSFGTAVTPDGSFLYTANQDSGTLSAFSIGADGSVSRLGPPVPAVDIPRGLAVSPNGRYLYVSHFTTAEGDRGTLSVFAIHDDGSIEQQGEPVPVGMRGAEITLSPDGRLLYITAQHSDQVFGFRIGTDGSPTPVPGSPYAAGTDAQGAAVTPDGHHLYIISDAVHGFTIDTDGSLTPIPGTPWPTQGVPRAVTPTPDGRHLYVSQIDSNVVFGYRIAPDGSLTQVPGSPFPAGGLVPGLKTLQVLPDQGPRASFTADAAEAQEPSRFDAADSTDSDGKVARYDWDFGDGATAEDAGPTPTHRYPHAGSFAVTLTVTDDEGCSTQMVFTGQSALCNGTSAARTTAQVTIP